MASTAWSIGVAQGDFGRRLTRYQIKLVPQLAYLAHSSHQRIFQHQTVPQIVTQVLVEQGVHADQFEFHLSGVYPEREYCVQFAESDLSFIQRLCAEEGIHYHFQHSPERHLLVFGDDQTVFANPISQRPTCQAQGWWRIHPRSSALPCNWKPAPRGSTCVTTISVNLAWCWRVTWPANSCHVLRRRAIPATFATGPMASTSRNGGWSATVATIELPAAAVISRHWSAAISLR